MLIDQAPGKSTDQRTTLIHSVPLRVLHWVNAISVLVLVPSGLGIYNAAPFYPFAFPQWMTLGGGLSGALLWHFAAMWLLFVSGIAYGVWRILLRAGNPRLFPLSVTEIVRNLRDVIRFKLGHDLGTYNGVQKLFYVGIAATLFLAVLSGLVLWKPVQLQGLASLMGGYEWARRVHFWSMAGTVGFLIVHIAMVILVPKTLLAMIFGVNVATSCENKVSISKGTP